jgi:NAD(P)-dependent dehydrogenase (short-subunit alcohol dehydrogenase family)
MSDRFKHKTIAITGGSKGLGLACTRALLDEGARVIVLSRSRGELAPLLEAHTGELFWIATDLADRASVVATFGNIREVCDRIDALVLNAALTAPCAFEELSEQDVLSNLLVNIAGPIYCLQQAAPLMEGGRAIFISSESVDNPVLMLALYASVKAAMETLVKGIRRELYKDRKIQLTILRSGSMEGTAFADHWPQAQREKFFELAASSGTLDETGTPMPIERVVQAVLFILTRPDDAAIHNMDLRSADSF